MINNKNFIVISQSFVILKVVQIFLLSVCILILFSEKFYNTFKGCIFQFKKMNVTFVISVSALDVASGEYGDVLERLVSGVENGRKVYQETSMATTPSAVVSSISQHSKCQFGYLCHLWFDSVWNTCNRWKFVIVTDTGDINSDEEVSMLSGLPKKKSETGNRLMYVAPFHTQVAVLLGRTWRTIWREKVSTVISLIYLFQTVFQLYYFE